MKLTNKQRKLLLEWGRECVDLFIMLFSQISIVFGVILATYFFPVVIGIITEKFPFRNWVSDTIPLLIWLVIIGLPIMLFVRMFEYLRLRDRHGVGRVVSGIALFYVWANTFAIFMAGIEAIRVLPAINTYPAFLTVFLITPYIVFLSSIFACFGMMVSGIKAIERLIIRRIKQQYESLQSASISK